MIYNTYAIMESLKGWGQNMESSVNTTENRVAMVESTLADTRAQVKAMEAQIEDLFRMIHWVRTHHPDVLDTYRTVRAVEDRLEVANVNAAP